MENEYDYHQAYMNPKVVECINTIRKKRALQEMEERERILIRAGLYESGTVEVKKGEPYDYFKVINKEKHYFCENEKIAIQVTDEEYAAIRAELEACAEDDVLGDTNEPVKKSWAETFYLVVAVLTWVLGGIGAIILQNWMMLGVVFVAGAVTLCISELFGRLMKIQKELRRISVQMKGRM